MSVNSKMTALADEIRTLSGTTTTKSIDAMTSDVDAANTEIAEQTELLEQIATALEGKTGSSGGAEDLNTELTTQESLISQLSNILDSKASGGSGGSVATCTVTIYPSVVDSVNSEVYYTSITDGMPNFETSHVVSTPINIKVMPNTFILIYDVGNPDSLSIESDTGNSYLEAYGDSFSVISIGENTTIY